MMNFTELDKIVNKLCWIEQDLASGQTDVQRRKRLYRERQDNRKRYEEWKKRNSNLIPVDIDHHGS